MPSCPEVRLMFPAFLSIAAMIIRFSISSSVNCPSSNRPEVTGRRKKSSGFRTVVSLKITCFFDGVLQFADIARPLVFYQFFPALRC